MDYALLRDNPGDPTAIPEAAAAIVEPGLEAPAKPQAENEQWTITSQDGLKLVATHFSPDKPSRLWAILVHGYGRNQSYVWDYAAEYIKRGYHVLTPDLRAAGLSEGKYLTMGVKESNDIVLWAKEIVQKDENAQIVLHGISMGAATVMMTAAHRIIGFWRRRRCRCALNCCHSSSTSGTGMEVSSSIWSSCSSVYCSG